MFRFPDKHINLCAKADLLCLPLRFDPIDFGWRQARKVYNCQTRGSSTDLWRPPLWRQVSHFELKTEQKRSHTCHVWKSEPVRKYRLQTFPFILFPLLSEKKRRPIKSQFPPFIILNTQQKQAGPYRIRKSAGKRRKKRIDPSFWPIICHHVRVVGF